jgi:hypothetical protein
MHSYFGCWRLGHGQNEDTLFRHRSPADLEEELFCKYISDVLLQSVAKACENRDFTGETVVLLTDSALAHQPERILRLLGKNNILAVEFPAHMINILQALNLVFFGAMKKRKATALGEFGEDLIDDQIFKHAQSYTQTATSMTIRNSFCKTVLFPDPGLQPFKLQFDEEKLRSNPGFEKPWDPNTQIEELPGKPRVQTF